MAAIDCADATAKKPEGGAAVAAALANAQQPFIFVHIQAQVIVRRAVAHVDAVKAVKELVKWHPANKSRDRGWEVCICNNNSWL